MSEIGSIQNPFSDSDFQLEFPISRLSHSIESLSGQNRHMKGNLLYNLAFNRYFHIDKQTLVLACRYYGIDHLFNDPNNVSFDCNAECILKYTNPDPQVIDCIIQHKQVKYNYNTLLNLINKPIISYEDLRLNDLLTIHVSLLKILADSYIYAIGLPRQLQQHINVQLNRIPGIQHQFNESLVILNKLKLQRGLTREDDKLNAIDQTIIDQAQILQNQVMEIQMTVEQYVNLLVARAIILSIGNTTPNNFNKFHLLGFIDQYRVYVNHVSQIQRGSGSPYKYRTINNSMSIMKGKPKLTIRSKGTCVSPFTSLRLSLCDQTIINKQVSFRYDKKLHQMVQDSLKMLSEDSTSQPQFGMFKRYLKCRQVQRKALGIFSNQGIPAVLDTQPDLCSRFIRDPELDQYIEQLVDVETIFQKESTMMKDLNMQTGQLIFVQRYLFNYQYDNGAKVCQFVTGYLLFNRGYIHGPALLSVEYWSPSNIMVSKTSKMRLYNMHKIKKP